MSRGMLNMFLDLRLNQLRCFLEQCIRGIRLFNFGMGICLFQFGIRLGINRQLGINDLFQLYFLNFDHISGLEDRIALLRFCQDIVELIMGSQHHSVHIPVAGALTIGQTQASSDHLLSKNLGCCRAKRHNGIEVVDIPTFLEHIDVDYDFYRVFGILHIQKQPGVGFGFCTFLLGMNNDGFVAVCAATELVRLYKLLHPCCMVGIFTDHQHKRLHDRLSMVDSINLQFPFGALMTGDAVQQHHFIQLLVPKVVKIDVGACDSKGCTSIAVLDGLGQRILIYNIFERNLLITLRHKGSRSKLQSQQRMQFIERLHSPLCPVMVRFIHNQHQVRQVGERLIERVTNKLVHLFHVCALFVELIDVIYEDMYIRFKQREVLFPVIVIRDNLRLYGKAAQPPEHILRTAVITQILLELLIDRGIGRNHEKVPDVVLRIQIGDESAHQPGFTHTGGQSKSQRHEIPLEIRTNRIHSMNCTQCCFQIHALAQGHCIRDFFQDFQRFCLRLAQRHHTADIVRGIKRKIIKHPVPPRHHTPADGRCSDCSRSCQTHSVPTAFAEFS